MSPEQRVEQVVLVDPSGHAVGVADKRSVHHRDTPLHLAFSSYLFSPDGRLLLTRRATQKRTWPGVWTNSVCGHPGPGEDIVAAVERRIAQELGTTVRDLQLVLPGFRYEATMPDGTAENELCPVFTGVAGPRLDVDPTEVADIAWVDWTTFRDEVTAERREVSPWCRLQVPELARAEVAPGIFAAATSDALPPAATPPSGGTP